MLLDHTGAVIYKDKGWNRLGERSLAKAVNRALRAAKKAAGAGGGP